jgi:hypothetical protein
MAELMPMADVDEVIAEARFASARGRELPSGSG